jgi:hypothetical protein
MVKQTRLYVTLHVHCPVIPPFCHRLSIVKLFARRVAVLQDTHHETKRTETSVIYMRFKPAIESSSWLPLIPQLITVGYFNCRSLVPIPTVRNYSAFHYKLIFHLPNYSPHMYSNVGNSWLYRCGWYSNGESRSSVARETAHYSVATCSYLGFESPPPSPTDCYGY